MVKLVYLFGDIGIQYYDWMVINKSNKKNMVGLKQFLECRR